MSELEVGQIIEGYEIMRVLGRGGMGTVYLANQVSMQREVALKVLAPELAKKDIRFCEKFVEEARVAGRLNHPNIIAVHDVSECEYKGETLYYFSMEVVEGKDCKELLEKGNALDFDLLADIMRGMGDALVYAELMNMVHRDIKPENIMVTNDNHIKLADLGLATSAGDNDVDANENDGKTRVMGTPRYMSPEQARAKPVDPRSDQYCLGATLFHLMTGEPPYEGRTSKELMRSQVVDPVPDPYDIEGLEHFPKEWRALCMRMMAKSADHRYPSAQALRDAIEDTIEGRIPKDGSRVLAKKRGQRKKSSSMMMYVGIGVAVAALAAVVLMPSTPAGPTSSNTPQQLGGTSRTSQTDKTSSETDEQLYIDKAYEIIAGLPDEHNSSMDTLRQEIRNPYFARSPKAMDLLDGEYRKRRDQLKAQQKQHKATLLSTLEKLQVTAKEQHNFSECMQQLDAWPDKDKTTVKNEFSDTRRAIALLVSDYTNNVIAQIDKAKHKDEVQTLLTNAQTQLGNLTSTKLAVSADAAIKKLTKLEKQQSKLNKKEQAAKDRKIWDNTIAALNELRGSGHFDTFIHTADQAVKKISLTDGKKGLKAWASLGRKLKEVDRQFFRYIEAEEPALDKRSRLIAMSTAERREDPQMIKVAIGKIGSTNRRISDKNIPLGELLDKALKPTEALQSYKQLYLWYWGHADTPGTALPQSPEAFWTIPSSIPEKQPTTLYFTRGSTKDWAPLFSNHAGKLEFHNGKSGLYWSTNTVTALSDTELPRLVLNHKLTPGTCIEFNCNIKDKSYAFIGLIQKDGQAVKLPRLVLATRPLPQGGFDTAFISALSYNKGKLTPPNGFGVSDGSKVITGKFHIKIELKTSGEVIYTLSKKDQKWVSTDDGRPPLYLSGKDSVQLIIQGYQKNKGDVAALIIPSMTISHGL